MNFYIDSVKPLILAEDWETAIAILEKAINENPKEIHYYWYLGIIYLLQGQEALAEELWMSILLQGSEENLILWTRDLVNLLEKFLWEVLETKKLMSAKVLMNSLYQLDENYNNYQKGHRDQLLQRI